MLKPFLCALAVVAICAGSIAAKPLGRILKDTGLSPEDFNMLIATEKNLVDRGQVGRTEGWENPATGAKGSSKIESRRGDCLYLQHFVTLPDDKPRQEFRTSFCRQADGQWLRTPT